MTAAEAAVSRTLEQYISSTNAGDLEAFKGILAVDVEFMPPDHPPVRGRESVGDWVRETFWDPFDIHFDASFERIVVSGGEAFAPGTFSLRMTPKEGGDAIDVTGEFFNTFREESDGSWKYAYGIWNLDQPLS